MDAAVRKFLDGISSPTRRRDAETMLELMSRATGQKPKVERTAVGYGQYHYKYASGREGDAAAAGFAAGKPATTVYVMDGVGAHTALLKKLGPHTTGVGCIYIKDLSKVDLAVLETIVARSYKTLTKGTYTNRARDGGKRVRIVSAADLPTIASIRRAAHAALDEHALIYLESGAGAERTLRWNEEAFERWTIRPRVLTGKATADTSTTLLGHDLSMPIVVSPFGLDKLFHPDGHCAVARGRGGSGNRRVRQLVVELHPRRSARGVARRCGLLPGVCARTGVSRRAPGEACRRRGLHRAVRLRRHAPPGLARADARRHQPAVGPRARERELRA